MELINIKTIFLNYVCIYTYGLYTYFHKKWSQIKIRMEIFKPIQQIVIIFFNVCIWSHAHSYAWMWNRRAISPIKYIYIEQWWFLYLSHPIFLTHILNLDIFLHAALSSVPVPLFLKFKSKMARSVRLHKFSTTRCTTCC